MRVQHFVKSNEICNDINTYLNYFDRSVWGKYTGILKWREDNQGIEPEEEVLAREVMIAVNICTYHRKEYILKNVNKLLKSKFFDENEIDYYGRLHIFITDNGSELENFANEFVHLSYNSNTGGSGGFQKGLECIRASGLPFTNVVFMDDDVEFLNETFYRLYALLSYMKEEFRDRVIAGRMFRKDQPWIQYTAAEIWNGGNLKHCGWQMDMSMKQFDMVEKNAVNDCENAEYSGWWFACFPASFCKNNDVLPVFIHCDDVEYGLRLGTKLIILNGIQVWHETYEYRQIKWMLYYDTRNSLFVNKRYGYLLNRREVFDEWMRKITDYHVKKDWQAEFYVIRAMNDFLKGEKWLKSINSEKLHRKIVESKSSKIKNAVAWRIVRFHFLFW